MSFQSLEGRRDLSQKKNLDPLRLSTDHQPLKTQLCRSPCHPRCKIRFTQVYWNTYSLSTILGIVNDCNTPKHHRIPTDFPTISHPARITNRILTLISLRCQCTGCRCRQYLLNHSRKHQLLTSQDSRCKICCIQHNKI